VIASPGLTLSPRRPHRPRDAVELLLANLEEAAPKHEAPGAPVRDEVQRLDERTGGDLLRGTWSRETVLSQAAMP